VFYFIVFYLNDRLWTKGIQDNTYRQLRYFQQIPPNHYKSRYQKHQLELLGSPLMPSVFPKLKKIMTDFFIRLTSQAFAGVVSHADHAGISHGNKDILIRRLDSKAIESFHSSIDKAFSSFSSRGLNEI